MPNLDSEFYVYRQAFDDVDDLAVQARQWQLDFRQLEKGRFRGEIQQLGAAGVHLAKARFHRTLRQKGTPPAGMRTIAISAETELQLKWRGRQVDGNCMMVFPRGAGLSSVSGPDFHVYTCSFPEELLGAVSESLEIGSVDQLCGSAEAIKISPHEAAALRSELLEIFEIVRADSGNLGRPDIASRLTERLPGQVVSSLASATGHCPTISTTRRLDAVRRAEAFIEQHVGERIRVRDIASVAGVSERTLEYAFLERFGIGPKQFLNAYRLCMARRRLLASDLHSAGVTDIANDFGFWHMGQFAADYRDRYGESPSESLRRSPGAHRLPQHAR